MLFYLLAVFFLLHILEVSQAGGVTVPSLLSFHSYVFFQLYARLSLHQVIACLTLATLRPLLVLFPVVGRPIHMSAFT